MERKCFWAFLGKEEKGIPITLVLQEHQKLPVSISIQY